MNALTRLVAATAAALCATVAIGCDNHTTPVLDTTSTTGADLNAMTAMRDSGAAAMAIPAATVPPLPAPIELDQPSVPAESNRPGASSVAPTTPTLPTATSPASPNRAATNGDSNDPASTFVGSSFGNGNGNGSNP